MLAQLGGWLFKHRSSIPIPFGLALLAIPPGLGVPALWTRSSVAGVLVVAAGEFVRLWAVHHIGVISRTRSERLGPLIETGPFSLVRNPLYLGNILIWTGFAIGAGLAWLAPIVALLLALEYHAIVRWEEQLLTERLGAPYRLYTETVPRWIPRFEAPASLRSTATFSWRETLFSERGTLIAIVVGTALLVAKARLWPH